MCHLLKPEGHPAVVFSPVRAKAWLEVATDEDFFRYFEGLKNTYAKRLYNEDANPHKSFSEYEEQLVEDYNKWKEKEPW